MHGDVGEELPNKRAIDLGQIKLPCTGDIVKEFHLSPQAQIDSWVVPFWAVKECESDGEANVSFVRKHCEIAIGTEFKAKVEISCLENKKAIEPKTQVLKPHSE